MNDFLTPLLYLFLTCLLGISVFWATTPLRRATAYTAMLVAIVVVWQTSAGMPRIVLPYLPNVLGMPAEGTMEGLLLDEPNAIYLVELPDDSETPIFLKLPWNEEQAAEWSKKKTDAEKEGISLQISHGEKGTNKDSSDGVEGSGETHIYPKPAKDMPPKIEALPQPPAGDAGHLNIVPSFDGPEHAEPSVVPPTPSDPHVGRNLPDGSP